MSFQMYNDITVSGFGLVLITVYSASLGNLLDNPNFIHAAWHE